MINAYSMPRVSPERRKLLAQVHMAKKDLALTDESYRAVLERVVARRSAAKCSDAQLRKVLAEFQRLGWKGGSKKPGRRRRQRRGGGLSDSQVSKLNALWHSLYALGEVRQPSEQALATFVKRQCGVEALAWLTPAQANTAIEALKDWCDRAGFTVPDTTGDGGLAAKQALCHALWARLHDLEVVRLSNPEALHVWLHKRAIVPSRRALDQLTAAQLDDAIQRLGRWVRQAMARKHDG